MSRFAVSTLSHVKGTAWLRFRTSSFFLWSPLRHFTPPSRTNFPLFLPSPPPPRREKNSFIHPHPISLAQNFSQTIHPLSPPPASCDRFAITRSNQFSSGPFWTQLKRNETKRNTAMPHAENGSATAPTVNGEKRSSQFIDVSERRSWLPSSTSIRKFFRHSISIFSRGSHGFQ